MAVRESCAVTLWQDVLESHGVIVKQRVAPRKFVWDSSECDDGHVLLGSMNIFNKG